MPVILLSGMAGIPARAQTEADPALSGRTGVLQAVEAEIADLFRANRRCVVRIHAIYGETAGGAGDLGSGYTHGTGFVIDDAGHILTVDKAVKGATEIRVTLADGAVSKAAFVASDPTSDVAVIRARDAEKEHVAFREHVVFGDSEGTAVGHYTFILGNAFGQLLPSVGMVYDVAEGEDLIQITSSVYPSYGGAPVFDSSGRVMGMVWAAPRYAQDRLTAGGQGEVPTSVFVIPINRARRIATALIEHGEVPYGWLGVEVDGETHPVSVTRVARGGPAWRAGIRPGDQIVAYNGHPVAGPFHLEHLVMETPPGESVSIRVRRESLTLSTKAEVVGRGGNAPPENPYGQFAGAAKPAATEATSGSVERALYEQIQTLERELGRLRSLMREGER